MALRWPRSRLLVASARRVSGANQATEGSMIHAQGIERARTCIHASQHDQGIRRGIRGHERRCGCRSARLGDPAVSGSRGVRSGDYSGGGADGILGKTVGKLAALETLKAAFIKEPVLPEKVVVRDHPNRARNFLKHGDVRISLDLENEAIQYIARAAANLITYDRSLPSEFPRFWAWVLRNRAEILAA